MAIDEKKLKDDVKKYFAKLKAHNVHELVELFFEDIIGIIDEQPKLDVPDTNVGKWIPVHKHMWKKGYDGKIDEWVWENGFHNGPQCELCYATPCVHCNPDWEASECSEISYECSECQTHVKDMTNYCPHCGVIMMPEPYKGE